MKSYNYIKLLLTTLVVVGYSSNAHSIESNDNIINTSSNNIIVNQQFASNNKNIINVQLSQELQNLYNVLDSEKIAFTEKLYLGSFDNIHSDIKYYIKRFLKVLNDSKNQNYTINILDLVRIISFFYVVLSDYSRNSNIYYIKQNNQNAVKQNRFNINHFNTKYRKNLPIMFQFMNQFSDALMKLLVGFFGTELNDIKKVIPCIEDILTDFQNTDFMPKSVQDMPQSYQNLNMQYDNSRKYNHYPLMNDYPLKDMNYDEVVTILNKYQIPTSEISKKAFEFNNKLCEVYNIINNQMNNMYEPKNDKLKSYFNKLRQLVNRNNNKETIQKIQWLLLFMHEKNSQSPYNNIMASNEIKKAFIKQYISELYHMTSQIKQYIIEILQQKSEILKSSNDKDDFNEYIIALNSLHDVLTESYNELKKLSQELIASI